MSQILTVARKELRGYFLSPVALIFLATFLFVVLFSFFWVDTFFRRNIADVRPLFHWLPLLLAFLVSALTMRLWSEEQRSGTLEVLLTMPVKLRRLVLGKFFAGLLLVAIALALTLGLPISVSMLGDLDWGPVIGGYLGALLLASSYLAVGLCISSTTENPIVALLLTGLATGGLYLIGSDAVTAFGGNRMGELLRALGTGSRFESIQRGVIDIRDLLYYGSLTVGFLYLNIALLRAKRWSEGASTAKLRSATKLSVGLVVANLIVANVLFSNVRAARVDLTERNEYSISDVTEKMLSGLDAPLLIRGYFSAKTHPLLAPLVPRIRDMIEEYGAVGGSNVRTEFIDPQQDPAAEKEANEAYGIKSVPFQFADRHEASVVNSYFQILVKYGDKHEVISFQDLIEVKVTGMRNIEVKLRNLEYDLTRAIKKVVYGFQPLEEVFARAPGKITLTAYITPDALPANLSEKAEMVKKVAKKLVKRSGGKLELRVVDPGGADKQALREKLYKKYGLKPFGSLLSNKVFYLHLLLSLGDSHERLYPSPEMTEADLENDLTAALKRLVPGFLKTVGLHISKDKSARPRNPMMRRRRPPQGPSYRMLREKLSETYSVKQVKLKDGRVPGDIDVLVVLGPKDFNDKQRYAIDQFLMRGGSVVIAGGPFWLDTSAMGGLKVKKIDMKLGELLGKWGVKVQKKLVLDEQNQAFPVPVERDVMGLRVREIKLLSYPFWVDVRGEGMSEGSPAVAGLPSVTLQWASPLEISKREGIKTEVLLSSSDKSWTQTTTEVQPDFKRFPKQGFGHDPGAKTKSYPLAISAKGAFTSAFKGKPSPLAEGGDKGKADEGKTGGRTIVRSPKSSRLVVIGTANFVRDTVLQVAQQTGSDRFVNNLRLMQNVVDWSVADVDLLSIRSRGSYARTLRPLDPSERSNWEMGNYAMVIVALLALIGIVVMRRRNLEPIQLVGSSRDDSSKTEDE